MFQAASLLPAVQDKSIEFVVIFEVNNCVGDGQEGSSLTSKLSIAISPQYEVPDPLSETTPNTVKDTTPE